MRNVQRRRRRNRGFTLIEVMLVLVILVILGSLVVGTYSTLQDQANIRAAKAQIGLFDTPLQMYYQSQNMFPTTDQGLQALREAPGDVPQPTKWIRLLEKPIPNDSWGNPYQYESPGTYNVDTYDIWSLGPDGADGTGDEIGNWLEE
ncbi:MAG TPA: type II secretion system major pseudopilin GspG [Thermoguttaceae bacterium]|nr:type II secretion system major pseudopilin GspG [Thermoguttaceae bacterium]